MKTTTLRHSRLLLAATSLLVVGSAHAASGTWDTDSAGNWTDFTNWLGDAAYAEGADSTATFGNFITVNRIITLDAPITIGNITASDTTHNYTISGANTLTLERTDSTKPTINVTTSTRILTISSVIDGTDGLQTTGAGTLVLTGTNSFTGGLEIDAGVVRAEGGGNSFGATGSTITIDGGQIHGRDTQVHQQGILLNQTKTSFVKGNGGTWEFTGAVSGTGGLAVNDAGSVFQRTLTFSSTANTFEGVIDMTPGSNATFQVNSLADSVTATGNIQFDNSNAYFGLGPGTAVPITLNNRRVELTGTTGGTNRIGNANTNTSNILTINTDLLATKTGAAAATRTLQLEGANAGDNAFNGDIANGTFDTLNVSKSGAGTWILGGTNTYNGTTAIATSGSTLVGTVPQAFGTNLSGITMAGGTILSLRNDSSVTFGVGANGYNINNSASGATINVDRVTGTVPNTISVGNLTTTSSAGDWTLNFTGSNNVSLSAGTLSAPAANTATTHTINNNIAPANGASLTLAGISEPSTDTAPVLNFTGSGITKVTGAITQVTAALSLTKNGSGVLALSGTNTYEGATDVNDGTLLVNGSTAAASAVSVGGGATLGGSGTINGTVSVAATANLAPGASTGTLTIDDDLNLSALAGDTGKLEFELASTAASDRIVITGTLSIGGGDLDLNDFDFSGLSGLQNGTYTLISSGAAVSGTLGTTTNGTLSGTFGMATIDLQISGGGTGNDIELVVSGLVGGSPFVNWAATGSLGPVNFGGDTNGDGVQDGIAFLLGVANPDDDANGSLPTVSEDGSGKLVMEFDCLPVAARGGASLKVAHSTTLASWTQATNVVPDTTGADAGGAVSYVIGAGPAGPPALNSVTATIDAAAGGKLFGRLEASE